MIHKTNFYRSWKFAFICIGVIFAGLLLTKVLFFNEFGFDDGDSADIAMNILKGKIIQTTQGNFLGCNRYFFTHPPLHFALSAVVFKIFGATYLTSKFISVLSAILLAIIVLWYCYRKMNRPIGAAISALILFDHLFFSYTYNDRMDMIATLFFTAAVLLFMEAEKRSSLKFMCFSGIFSALAMLSSYNCNWLFIAFAGYALYLIVFTGFRKNFTKIAAYSVSALLIMGPWYGWILMDKVRRGLCFAQVIGNTSSADGYALSYIVRKMLNPLADLYVALFRFHSPYPVILLVVLIYLAVDLKKHLYPFLLLLASLVMMFFNQRAAHYYVIILPLCYICFGRMLEAGINTSRLKPALKNILTTLLAIALFTGLFNDISLAVTPSNIKLDSRYYGQILKENTKEGSRIATDLVFVIADHGNREIVGINLLIWKMFRKSLKNYDEMIAKVADVDYIILTERNKKWGELPIDQSIDFQKYLKERCTLLKIVDDKIHGPIWIYKSNHRTAGWKRS